MSTPAAHTQKVPDMSSLSGSSSALTDVPFTANHFPKSYQLIITTTKGVYAWDASGIKEIFRSNSAGIVAARKLSGESEILAVADSQVVILHDLGQGLQRSYRLKGSEVDRPLMRSEYVLT